MLLRRLSLFALATTFVLFTSDHPSIQWHELAAQAVILSENHLEDKSASQTPRDMSAAFASAENVKVTQITGGPDSNMLSYYDVNLYSAFADRLIYNSTDGIKAKAGKKGNAVWKVVSAKTDGTGAEVLVTRASPSISVDRADLSYDGRFVSYIRNNTQPEKGWDLYGFRLAKSGREEELRITRKQFPVDLTPKIKTSSAVFDKKPANISSLSQLTRRCMLYVKTAQPRTAGANLKSFLSQTRKRMRRFIASVSIPVSAISLCIVAIRSIAKPRMGLPEISG